MACDELGLDPKLHEGFNALGFSQGGQFLRALVQRCGKVRVYNLITLGSQHQGIYGFPFCTDSWLCDVFRKLLSLGAYLSFVQASFVQAQFWHDPIHEDEYRLGSAFLSDINQEIEVKQAYKERITNLSNFVMVKFLRDRMVQPSESEWFGFYRAGQSNQVYTLNEMSPCRKACKWLSWSIGVGTFIFECAAVAWACVHYWRAFVIYFALSVAFVLVPAIVTTVKSLLWLQSYDIQRIRRQGTCLKRLNAVSIFLHLLSMGFVYRYITLVRLSITGEQDINLFEADTVLVRFLHTFLCSAPQITLQLSFIISFPMEPAARIAAVVIAASVLSLIYGLVTFAGSDYLRTRDHHITPPTHHVTPTTHQYAPLAHMVLASWHICMVVARVLAFALFSCTYGAMVFVVVAAHWSVMFSMLVVSRMVCYPKQPASTQPKKRWFSELPFESMASFGYVFVFFRLKHNCMCLRVGVVHLVVFHLLTWLENIAMVTLFFVQKQDLWYSLGSLPLVIGLPVMGVLLFLIYHTVLNPAKRWHCVGLSCCGWSSCSNSIDVLAPTQQGVVSSDSVDTLDIGPSSSVLPHTLASHPSPRTYSTSPEVGSLLPEAIGTTQHPPGPSSSVSGPQSTLPTSMSELSSHDTSPEMMCSTRLSVSPIEAAGPSDRTVRPSEEKDIADEPAPNADEPAPNARLVCELAPRSVPDYIISSHQPLHSNPCQVQGTQSVSRPLPTQLRLSQDDVCTADASRTPVARTPVLIMCNKMDSEVIPQQQAPVQLKQIHTTLPQDLVRSAHRSCGNAQIGPRSVQKAPNCTHGAQLQSDACFTGYAVTSILQSNANNGTFGSRHTPQTRSVSLPRNAGGWRNSAVSHQLPHNRLTPHHLIPHHLIPHHLTPHHLIPYHLIPHHLTPHHLISHHLTPHHLTPHHLIPHHLTPHYLIPHHLIPHHLIPHHLTPHHLTHITSSHTTSPHITSSHTTSSHITSFHGTDPHFADKKEFKTTPHTPTTVKMQVPCKSQTTHKGVVVFAVTTPKTNSSKSLTMSRTPFVFPTPNSSPYHILPSQRHVPPISRGSSSPLQRHHGLVPPPRTAQVPRPSSLGQSLLGDDVDMPLWIEKPHPCNPVPPVNHTYRVLRIPPQNASTSEV
eukprot:Em0023g35a